MTKILMLLVAISSLSACESSTAGKSIHKNAATSAKDITTSWSAEQRKAWLDKCLATSGNTPGAKTICLCMLEKTEKKYVRAADAKAADEEEMSMLGKECMIAQNTSDIIENESADNNPKWTAQQRREFVEGCTVTAQHTQGFTREQAAQYCDCMTRKVEKKYAFDEASKLKAADFQTREWSEESMDCRSRLNY